MLGGTIAVTLCFVLPTPGDLEKQASAEGAKRGRDRPAQRWHETAERNRSAEDRTDSIEAGGLPIALYGTVEDIRGEPVPEAVLEVFKADAPRSVPLQSVRGGADGRFSLTVRNDQVVRASKPSFAE